MHRLCRPPVRLGIAAALALIGGCASEPPAPASISIVELMQRPAEHALVEGLRLYEEGSFERAEAALRSALGTGLQDRRDTAVAFKFLAFIACAFNRPLDCEQSFVGAFRADPQFRLSTAEIGHPLWGPVYRRVAATFGNAALLAAPGASGGRPSDASQHPRDP